MRRIWDFLLDHSSELLFGATLVIICYLIARLLNVRPLTALVFGFLPLLVAIAFTTPSTLDTLARLIR
jgi:dolichyl-phosphate-mannose--protein O-mannosyl transferase